MNPDESMGVVYGVGGLFLIACAIVGIFAGPYAAWKEKLKSPEQRKQERELAAKCKQEMDELREKQRKWQESGKC